MTRRGLLVGRCPRARGGSRVRVPRAARGGLVCAGLHREPGGRVRRARAPAESRRPGPTGGAESGGFVKRWPPALEVKRV